MEVTHQELVSNESLKSKWVACFVEEAVSGDKVSKCKTHCCEMTILHYFHIQIFLFF